jgi:hypothetical protein
MTTRRPQYLGIAAIALAASAIAGCADHSKPENVDRRAVERWNYLIAHQAEKAYDYLTPGFRATQAKEVYAAAMNTRPVQWKSAKFNHKECEEDRCTVHVDVAYAVPMAAASQGAIQSASTQSETWIRIDGEWYFLPK